MPSARHGRSDRADVLDEVPTVKHWMDEVERTLEETRRLNDAAWEVVFRLKEELYRRLDARLAASEENGVEETSGTTEAV